MPATTQMLVETLAIGSIASVWAGLLLAHFPRVRGFLSVVSDHEWLVPLLLLVGIAAIYQLGWCVNWIAWRIARRLFECYRRELFRKHGVDWQEERPKFRQKASEAILRELEHEVSEMRMCRANTVNGLLIAIALLTYGLALLPLAAIALGGSAILAIQTRQIHRHHFEKLLRIYERLLIEGN
jgi:hypothetical protein